MGRLFGTDGVRGMANTALTCDMAMNIGRALGAAVTDDHRPCILLGRDTRASSVMLAAAVAAGLCSVGAEVRVLGVVPAPAVAHLTRVGGADGGVMIGAAHTPCVYNGIKVFDREGQKSSALESRIEAILLDGAGTLPCPVGGEVGTITEYPRAAEEYIQYLTATAPTDLRGMRIAVDCAGGAAAVTAERVFRDLGAQPLLLGDQPNGVNINDGCGTAHIEALAEYVKAHKCFGGVAFDGDGERCVAIDEKGNILDGDRLLAAFALDAKEKGTLAGDTVCATALSNLGFFRFCEENGVRVVSAAAGSRAVAEEMARQGCVLGGEPNGNLVLKAFSATADGQLAAVQLLALCREKGCKLSAVEAQMPRSPQVMISVKADDRAKAAYVADSALLQHIADIDASLGGDGRVTVRPSETEPLIRIVVEGREFDEINGVAVALADTIKKAIGV